MKNHLGTAVLLAIISSAAWAGSPHFVRGPTGSLDNSGNYVVSFKEAGLGNSPITYSLTVQDGDFTFQCYNPANNTPQGDPNGVSISNATVHTTITPRNGQITGSITMSPTTGGAQCQGRAMKLCLVAVSYSGVQFKDETTPVGPFNMPSLSMTLRNPICDF